MSYLEDIATAHHRQAGRAAQKTIRSRAGGASVYAIHSPWLDECRKVGRKITTRVERRLVRLERRHG